jgi:hypothetical protein
MTSLRDICEANCTRNLAAIRKEREAVRKHLEQERQANSVKRFGRLG